MASGCRRACSAAARCAVPPPPASAGGCSRPRASCLRLRGRGRLRLETRTAVAPASRTPSGALAIIARAGRALGDVRRGDRRTFASPDRRERRRDRPRVRAAVRGGLGARRRDRARTAGLSDQPLGLTTAGISGPRPRDSTQPRTRPPNGRACLNHVPDRHDSPHVHQNPGQRATQERLIPLSIPRYPDFAIRKRSSSRPHPRDQSSLVAQAQQQPRTTRTQHVEGG